MKKSKLTGFYLDPKGEAYLLERNVGSQVVWVSFIGSKGKVVHWATTKADATFMVRMEKLIKIGEV